MKLQQLKALSDIYSREEAFSKDLLGNIDALDVGSFEDSETEANVGTRKADIVAVGDDGTLVIENQFGKADWDHWGRLEAYARLREADVAVLIAEDFEELMVVTCHLRNEDSEIRWYLIRACVNLHDELSFVQVARPAIDIPTGGDGEYSEFWAPIRKSGLFAGKPVPARDTWIAKGIKGITLCLQLHNHGCSVVLYFQGEDRIARRGKVLELFPDAEYTYEVSESPKFAKIIFPVMDKGRKDPGSWHEIRSRLTSLGEEVYHKIEDADV